MTHGVKTNSDPIREVYVTDPKRPSVQDLADRYEVPYTTLKQIALREEWTRLRDEYRQKLAQETYQKHVNLESERRAELLDKGKQLAHKIIEGLLDSNGTCPHCEGKIPSPNLTVADLNCMHRLLSFTAGGVDSRAGVTQPDISGILRKLSEKAEKTEKAESGEKLRIARKSA